MSVLFPSEGTVRFNSQNGGGGGGANTTDLRSVSLIQAFHKEETQKVEQQQSYSL